MADDTSKNITHMAHTSLDDIRKPSLDGVFRKSSLSGTGNCVTVAKRSDGSVQVRDTKDVTEQTLTYTKDEWLAFIGGVKLGEFDLE